MTDTASDPWLWFLGRASGIVSLALLSVSVVIGILSAGGWRSRTWPRFVSERLHRNASLLAMVFVVVHVVAIELHSSTFVTWRDDFIPFGARFRPLWVGFGTLAFDLMAALVVTSMLRRHISARIWRLLHWAAYASWLMGIAHCLGTGTDTRAGWSMAIDGACVMVAVLALLCRLASGWPRNPRVRLASLALTVVALIQMGMWATSGPLDSAWASHAGTPPRAAATTPPAP